MTSFDDIRGGLEGRCTRCGACAADCLFLREHGTPGELAARMTSPEEQARLAYLCSLCGHCNATCDAGCRPVEMFEAAREEVAGRGDLDRQRYHRFLAYESIGISPLFTWYGLPKGCTRVFFPGCATAGIRPELTWRTFTRLQADDPALGIVLDCCSEPSRMLGLREQFQRRTGELLDFLAGQGVRELVFACPGCVQSFRHCDRGMSLTTAYDALSSETGSDTLGDRPPLIVHDSCITRFDRDLQDGVRRLVSELGGCVRETPHSRDKAVCCGECGAVKFVDPALADSWRLLRNEEAGDDIVLTYCAACLARLAPGCKTVHVLDLVFFGRQALDSPSRVPSLPRRYFNRLLLKRRFRKRLKAATTRVRPRGL